MKTAILIIAFLSQPASGRVGYSLQQCQEKYGKEVAKSDETKVWVFLKNEIYIMANIEDGKVVSMGYSKSDGTRFSDAEITMILMKNHKDGKDGLWIKTNADCWNSKDGELIATQVRDIQMGRPVLTINDKAWFDTVAKKLKALNDL